MDTLSEQCHDEVLDTLELQIDEKVCVGTRSDIESIFDSIVESDSKYKNADIGKLWNDSIDSWLDFVNAREGK